VDSRLPRELKVVLDPRQPIFVDGSRPVAAALHDFKLRQADADLLYVEIEDDLVAGIWNRGTPETTAVRETVKLARQFRLNDVDWARRLRENVEHDPMPLVRRSSLAVLLAEFPGSEDATLAIRVGLVALDPDLALLAARALGEEGVPALLAIARDGDACRASALETLEKTCSRDRLVGLARDALGESMDPATQRLGLRLAAIAPSPAVGPRIAELGKNSPSESTAELAIAALLALNREVPAEPALLEIVNHRFEHSVLLQALEALGEVGELASLEVLSRLTGPLGRVAQSSDPVRHAAQAARAKVSARLAQAGTGRLSLSQEGAEGRLSALDGTDGGLALSGRELDGSPKA
jgi:hypothetical protein